jgi:hypothetical protein
MEQWIFFWKPPRLTLKVHKNENYLCITNNEIVQNSKSEAKKFSFLCTFQEGLSMISFLNRSILLDSTFNQELHINIFFSKAVFLYFVAVL